MEAKEKGENNPLEYMTVFEIHKTQLSNRLILAVLLLLVLQPAVGYLVGAFTWIIAMKVLFTVTVPILVAWTVYFYLEFRRTKEHLKSKYKNFDEIQDSREGLKKKIRRKNDDLLTHRELERGENIREGTKQLLSLALFPPLLLTSVYGILDGGSKFLPIPLLFVFAGGAILLFWHSKKRFKELYNNPNEYLKDIKWYIGGK